MGIRPSPFLAKKIMAIATKSKIKPPTKFMFFLRLQDTITKSPNRIQCPNILPPIIYAMVTFRFARLCMSASGTKRTYRVALHMSAFGGKADSGRTCPDVP